MNPKKSIGLRLLFLSLLTVIVLSSCGGDDMHPEEALAAFSKKIEQGNLDNVTLTIWYQNPFWTTMHPYRIEHLTAGGGGVHKIIIDGSELKYHINLLRQINVDILMPVTCKSQMDIWLYYEFTDERGRKIFGVALQSGSDSVFINDVELEWNDIFLDAIRSFLPEYMIRILDASSVSED